MNEILKRSPIYKHLSIKKEGSCKVGERSDLTGCTPDDGEGGAQASEASNGSYPKNQSLPNQSRPELSDKEIAEVESYGSEQTEYYDVNSHLRGGGKLFDDTLQRAILKTKPFPNPVQAFRGIETDDVDALIQELETGEFVDAGFMSCSTISGGAFRGNVQFVIEAKQGLDASHYIGNEHEILLPAGSGFKVVGLEVNNTRSGKKVFAKLEQII